MTSGQNVTPDSNSYLPSLSRVPRQARMAANGGPGKFSVLVVEQFVDKSDERHDDHCDE
jgi:hypothetical protein